MRTLTCLFTLFFLCFTHVLWADTLSPAITQPIPITDLKEYPNYPPVIKKMITQAALLSQQKLTYLYGSSNPQNGGMDCSGTIFYLLNTLNVPDVPRSSNDMFLWAEQKGHVYRVKNQNLTSAEFSKLNPGDLLFWSGTYGNHSKGTITHVMIYLGKNKHDEPLMFGSSDGRTYQGKQMWGVSVFDFMMPDSKSSAKFVGYGCVPGLTCVH